MAATTRLRGGPVTWGLDRDRDGYRTYKVVHFVEVVGMNLADPNDRVGPQQILDTDGLPQPGDTWAFGSDMDPSVVCKFDAKVSIHREQEGDPPTVYRVEQVFTNKPDESDTRPCNAFDVTDPLDEPQKVSGRFVKYVVEAAYDRHGNPLMNRAFEQLRGPQVEFENNHPTIRVEQNVADLELPLLISMVDTVNDASLWGFPRRCIKLSNVSWERKFSGRYASPEPGTGTGTGTDTVCEVYYTRVLEFDVNVKRDPVTGELVSGFDRILVNWGTKVLSGHWDAASGNWVSDPIEGYAGFPNPDPTNPTHFVRYRDRHGDYGRILLDEAGQPAGVIEGTGSEALPTGSAITLPVEYYPETNFLLLNPILEF